jgi:hypothetical protein
MRRARTCQLGPESARPRRARADSATNRIHNRQSLRLIPAGQLMNDVYIGAATSWPAGPQMVSIGEACPSRGNGFEWGISESKRGALLYRELSKNLY